MRHNIFVSRPTLLGGAILDGFYQRLDDKEFSCRTLGIGTDHTNDAPFEAVWSLMQLCQGIVLIGVPRALARSGSQQDRTTEWNHIEAGMAHALGLPMLVLCHEGASGGAFNHGALGGVVHGVDLSDPAWVNTDAVTGWLKAFRQKIEKTPDSRNGDRHVGETSARLVRILRPEEGGRVGLHQDIRGAGPDDTEVWTVIHPVGHQWFYVQGPNGVRNGEWRVPAQFGEPPDTNVVFEIRALVHPLERISDKDKLRAWPLAEYHSFTRFVVRQ